MGLRRTDKLAQECIEENCPEFIKKYEFGLVALIWTPFIKKYEWRPNSPDLNPLDYHVWGEMLELYQCYTVQNKKLSKS